MPGKAAAVSLNRNCGMEALYAVVNLTPSVLFWLDYPPDIHNLETRAVLLL
jgi:hypothetical protein